MLTIVGMGAKTGDLTVDGREAILKADYTVVKSSKTHAGQTVSVLGRDAVCCDDLYDSADDFDELNNLIIGRLNGYSLKGTTVFCVVGGGEDDSTVTALRMAKIPFKLVSGVSIASQFYGEGVEEGTAFFSAPDFISSAHVLPVSTVIKSIDDKLTAGEVRLRLSEAFDFDTEIIFSDGKRTKKIMLHELEKQNFSYLASVYVKAKEIKNKEVFGFYDAVEVMKTLRSENGCPWDKVQTHSSLKKNVIEEAYELSSALDKQDIANIVEELGDLLMQVLFHIEIGEDEGEFAAEDVYSALCRKLIDRHPHVFATLTASNEKEALFNWEKAKQKEHKIKGIAENILDVPKGMSALMRANKVQYRASKGGYDFTEVKQCVCKLKEEIREFLAEVERNDAEKMTDEAGDLLFSAVNLLRLTGVDQETALCRATEKFISRVLYIEKKLAAEEGAPKAISPDKLDELWEEAKLNAI